MSDETATRRNDVDWLRVFATYMLFPFHVAMVFNPAPFYHVRNDELSFLALIVCGFVSLWHMPLFFLLAGWSMRASLVARGVGGFLRERVFRLVIPLVFGCVVLMPPIKYFELRSGLDANFHGLRVAARVQPTFSGILPSGALPIAADFNQSFREFLPTFFTNPERFTWAHLWFVVYLLTFTLLYLPILVALSRRSLAVLASPPRFALYLPILPLALVQIFLRPRWPGLQNLYDDWANFAYYSIYFLSGFALASSGALEGFVRAERARALAIASATTLFLLLATLGVFSHPSLILAGSAISGWCFVIALCGYAREHWNSGGARLRWLAESAFPVYLLHQSAVVLCGFWIVQQPWGPTLKFAALLVASASATLLTYRFVVLPLPPLRFLCGMKGRRRDPAGGVVLTGLRQAVPLLVVAFVVAAAEPAPAAGPLGSWYAEGGAAQVDVAPCGEEVCGTIVWLRSPYDENGCELADRNNPDVSRRTRRLIGLRILSGLRRSRRDPDVWEGGTIYDPTSGRTYDARVAVENDDRLDVRGYLGVPLLGRSSRWLRVGAEERVCAAAE